MIDEYTMTVGDVHAWRVADDGSIPDDALMMVKGYSGEWSDKRGGWVWYSDIVKHHAVAKPGDWIVSHEYGLESFADSYFREVCTRIDQRTVTKITDAMVDTFSMHMQWPVGLGETDQRKRVRAALAAALAVEEWDGK